jgi:hypothetical protein
LHDFIVLANALIDNSPPSYLCLVPLGDTAYSDFILAGCHCAYSMRVSSLSGLKGAWNMGLGALPKFI